MIKQGKVNYTYSIKYYGVDEGQIGILTRKVPFDDNWIRQKPQRLPRLRSEMVFENLPKKKEEMVEIEVSEDEEYFTEEEEEEPLPTVSKPLGIDVVQGSLSGAEFAKFKTDSKPLE